MPLLDKMPPPTMSPQKNLAPQGLLNDVGEAFIGIAQTSHLGQRSKKVTATGEVTRRFSH